MKKIIFLSALAVIAISYPGPIARAQTTTDSDGSVTTTEPSDKYGAGGKHVTKSDKNYKLLVEAYYDKCGRIRESILPYKSPEGQKSVIHAYYDENGKPAVRVIEYPNGKTTYMDVSGGEDHQKNMDPAAAKALIAKLEKTPSAPCPEPPKAAQQPKEKVGPTVEINPLTPGTYPRFELGVGYNYIYAPKEDVKDLHGFNASFFYNANSWLSLGGEFMGGWGCEREEFVGFDVHSSLDRYAYFIGPRVSYRPCDRFRIFGQVMVGGDHDNSETTFITQLAGGGSSKTRFSASADSWAFDFGVGADWQFAKHWSWRIFEASYLATTFSSGNGDHWQDNWRVSTGVVFRFGGNAPAPPEPYTKEAQLHVK